MNRYRIEYTGKAHKQLMAIAEPHRSRIVQAIDALAVQPRGQGTVKLAGQDDLYRIRVGGYRVIYAIRDRVVTVTVTSVGTRGSIYNRL